MTDQEYMRQALELAERGMGYTSPNPMVGCVVVQDGRVVAKGYHERYGEFHAERNALIRCHKDLTGAELYVTLEPCCHHGKTPPCTDIIIERGIKKVYVGSMDPNPKVAGKGVRILEEHGIQVETGVLEKECLALNEIFFHYITTGLPFVAMKYAMTLDGKIAACTGDSKWVTGEDARRHAHTLRRQYRAILAGIGTVLADDPMLNCRTEENVDPVRIICDSKLRLPLSSQIVKTADRIPTIVAYVAGECEKEEKLRHAGIELLPMAGDDKVDLAALMRELGKRQIDSVLVEGGGEIHGTLMKRGLAQKLYCYVAPKLIGGRDARSPIEGEGLSKMSDALSISDIEMLHLGEDICISGYIMQRRG